MTKRAEYCVHYGILLPEGSEHFLDTEQRNTNREDAAEGRGFCSLVRRVVVACRASTVRGRCARGSAAEMQTLRPPVT